MGDNSKPTQNPALSFELTDWLDTTERLAGQATLGPWVEDGSLIGPRPGASVAQVWGVRWKADGAFIAHARTALPQAVAALRAVLDLHAPDREWGHICGHCTDFDTYGSEWIDYPCPTITAIQDTLGEE